MKNEIKHLIEGQITTLKPFHQLAFGVMLTERFLPNYFAFFLAEQWGNPMVLLNGIDLLKNIIVQRKHDPTELQLIDDLIESVTPDMEAFPGNTLASMALDVSSMLYECFAFVRTKDPKHIKNCSSISFSTLEAYLQKRDKLPHDADPYDLDDFFANEPLTVSEIEFQRNLLRDLNPKAKINSKLYIDKTLIAPNLVFHLCL